MACDYKDLKVVIKSIKTGDYTNSYMVVEVKASIDDFISSFTSRKQRKDGSEYKRMESQLERLLAIDKPIKIILINGSMKDAYSRVHPNSIRGMIASIICQGITVLWTDDPDWPEMVYRLHRKSLKYGSVFDKKRGVKA